jgi:hypothetical protein
MPTSSAKSYRLCNPSDQPAASLPYPAGRPCGRSSGMDGGIVSGGGTNKTMRQDAVQVAVRRGTSRRQASRRGQDTRENGRRDGAWGALGEERSSGNIGRQVVAGGVARYWRKPVRGVCSLGGRRHGE